MKKVSSFIFTGMLFLSLNLFAAPKVDVFPGTNPLHEEISKILSGSSLFVEKDFWLTVYFTVSQDNTIQIRSITSPRPEVNEYFITKLQCKKLQGSNLVSNKVYELPVRVKVVR